MNARKEAEKYLLKGMPDHVQKLHKEAKVHDRNKSRAEFMDRQRRAGEADFRR